MSQLDLAQHNHRMLFSDIQMRGFARLAELISGDTAEATSLINRMTEPAGNGRKAANDPALSDALDADAVAYVALGSQLGLTVLRRNLPEDERTGIFEHEPDVGAWKDFAARISAVPGDTDQAQRTIDDARRAFDIFHTAAQEALDPLSEKTL